MNDGWHGESVENVVVHLGGSVETVAAPKMRRVSTVEDGGCAWMALIEPSTAPPAAVAAAGGFKPPPSKSSFTT